MKIYGSRFKQQALRSNISTSRSDKARKFGVNTTYQEQGKAEKHKYKP